MTPRRDRRCMFKILMSALFGALLFGDLAGQTSDAGVSPQTILSDAQKAYESAFPTCSAPALGQSLDRFRAVCGSKSLEQYARLCCNAKYGEAWVYFRLGERTGEAERFAESYRLFDSLFTATKALAAGDTAVARLRAYACYMAGEARLREVETGKWTAISDYSLSAETAEKLIKKLDDADDHFEDCLADGGGLAGLLPFKGAAAIRKQDIEFEKGVLWELADQDADAKARFDNASYVMKDVDPTYEPLVNELKVIHQVRLAACGKPTNGTTIDAGLLDDRDQALIMGNWYQAVGLALMTNGEDAAAKDLLRKADSQYQIAVDKKIAEAYYWRGLGQLMLGEIDDAAISAYFAKFIGLAESAEKDGRLERRVKILLSDAVWKAKLTEICKSAAANTDARINELLSGVGNRADSVALSTGKYLIKRAANTPNDATRGPLRKSYLIIAQEFLKTTRGSHNNDLRSEAIFYDAIIEALRAASESNQKCYDTAAGMLDEVILAKSRFSDEAKYLQAMCRYYTGQLSKADTLFRDLVKRRHSVRALYHLGQILSASYEKYKARLCDDGRSPAAQDSCNRWASIVIEAGRTGNPPNIHQFAIQEWEADSCFRIFRWKTNEDSTEYGFFRGKIGTESIQFGRPDKAPSPSFDTLDIESVVCPDTLIKGDDFFCEKITEMKAVRLVANDGLNLLRKFGFAKRTLYPTNHRLVSSVIESSSFSDKSAGIPDVIAGNTAWDLILHIREASGRPIKDSVCCSISSAACDLHDTLRPREDGVYFKLNITCGGTAEIKVTHPKYYTARLTIPRREYESFDDTIVLSWKISSYDICDDSLSAALDAIEVTRPHGVEYGIVAKMLKNLSVLNESKRTGLRDIAFDPVGRRFLAVDRDSNNALVVAYPKDDGFKEKPLRLGSNVSLDCPEGIAVDRQGIIYIADWGNNRIVAFNNSGNDEGTGDTLFTFPRQSDSSNADALSSRFLTLPTRIALEEDAGQRETYILVLDRYGIHRFDSRGRYLDTPIPLVLLQSALGSVHGSVLSFAVTGYGEEAKIAVVDRVSGKVQVFAPKCQ